MFKKGHGMAEETWVQVGGAISHSLQIKLLLFHCLVFFMQISALQTDYGTAWQHLQQLPNHAHNCSLSHEQQQQQQQQHV